MLAAGGALFAGQAVALELGELDVHSALGQPLRASVAYALGPNEQLAGYCIYLRGGSSGLPAVSGARASLDGGRIVLTGSAPLLEPMMSLQLSVDCPYTPHLRRDYLLMLDPGGQAVSEPGDRSAAVRERADVTVVAPVRRAATPPRIPTRDAPAAAPVAKGTAYRVQPGDTLSGVAERIPDRRVALWPAVDALFAANPDAFIGGDPDRLKAGIMLTIPDELAATEVSSQTVQQVSSPPMTAGTASTQLPVTAPADDRGAATAVSPAAPTAEAVSGYPLATESQSESADVAPATPVRPNVTIPDTRIDAVPVPVVGNRVSADDVGSGGSLSWLMWLGGTGIAIILGLLLFGRSFGERVGGASAASTPQRRRADRGEAPLEHDITDDLQDTISRAQVFEVDANLGDGSGFDSTPDIDVAQEFNFAAPDDQAASLDLAFDESSAREPDEHPTDMISPLAQDQSVIVDREVLPGHDEDEGSGYDLSMVVDATQQNFDEVEGTTRDLHAIEVQALDDGSATTGAYTLNEEAGYRLIEQDYEEELTATQILNKQMEKAARELSESLGTDGASTKDDGATADKAQVSMAEDLEGTAEVTTSLPAEDQAVNDDLGNADVTVEMPADQNEATVEMEPERTRQRKSKAS